MKKNTTLLLVLFISVVSFAQVGIGTNIPQTSSILELKAADKALLLTRVANTAAVTTPVNGMMVYDISSNCIKGYQNGAWTGCLSACANTTSNISTGGEFGMDFTSTMKQISATYDYANGFNTGCITTDGKVFMWGQNQYFFTPTPTPSDYVKPTPVYSPLPNGELAAELVMSGYVAMVLTTTGKVYVMGKDNVNFNLAFANIPVQRVWTQVTIPGETSFVDIEASASGRNSFIRASSGKIYRCGLGAVGPAATTYTQMLFPAGVSSYTDMWDLTYGLAAVVFFKGNDNNIYAVGSNSTGNLGTGTTNNIDVSGVPVKVLFPAGVNNIVKISSNNGISLALTATGTAYGWGSWQTSGRYLFAATPLAADVSGSNILKPSPIPLPTLNTDTKFTDIWAGAYYTAVRTDKMVYFKGYNYSGILMNPITADSKDYSTGSPDIPIDMVVNNKYNMAAPVWNKFKTIITGGSGASNNFLAVFAINQDNRGYVWGYHEHAAAGIGGGRRTQAAIPRPTPIATGIGDPLNPNPLY